MRGRQSILTLKICKLSQPFPMGLWLFTFRNKAIQKTCPNRLGKITYWVTGKTKRTFLILKTSRSNHARNHRFTKSFIGI